MTLCSSLQSSFRYRRFATCVNARWSIWSADNNTSSRLNIFRDTPTSSALAQNVLVSARASASSPYIFATSSNLAGLRITYPSLIFLYLSMTVNQPAGRFGLDLGEQVFVTRLPFVRRLYRFQIPAICWYLVTVLNAEEIYAAGHPMGVYSSEVGADPNRSPTPSLPRRGDILFHALYKILVLLRFFYLFYQVQTSTQ